jgi:glutathione peroxidase
MITIKPDTSARTLSRLLAACALGLGLNAPAEAAASCSALLNRTALRLQDEKPQDLCQYAGQVVVVVNTASFCGFTPQYKALESLYERYRSRGLVVLGFPSNDFSQEPGTNKDVADFCENTFGVKFPMFAKSRVSASAGAELNPLFAELSRRSGKAPQWNFHKYLIARDGTAILSRASDVDPASRAFVQEIEKLLDAQPSPK